LFFKTELSQIIHHFFEGNNTQSNINLYILS